MSFHWPACSRIAVLVIFSVVLADCQFYRQVGPKKIAYNTITVDPSGRGNFSKIQSAIDSIPSYNMYWTTIKIKAGVYREKIKIPYDKPYIILKGKGKRRTQIVWDDHDSLEQSPTFNSLADNIIVKSMTFINSYNFPVNNNHPRTPAVAAKISGDKSTFFRCGFYGLQDTLWDDHGRHYYKRCTIQGAVDFIFGGGQSLFENCAIAVLGGALEPGLAGFITAQGRTSPSESNGFVFKECNVFGTGSTFLGRPWREFSRVLFYNSSLSNVIVPQGWNAWDSAGQEDKLTFAEHGCYGEGSETSKRVSWEKQLSEETLKHLIGLRYINSDGWLHQLPS
ncbi:probable pectinesterase 29 [Ziziphus jujuba]|uniref:Pectinesterase n=1 Tax=Ziziphus jujuba TaxID=326968 RepID=A0A6P4A312_ZIZJJ|nr:probable pectinesterase 29 [Ziziphus jujuba]